MAAGQMGSIVVCLLTYGRLDYAKRTLKAVLDNICTTHPLAVHIASDGDDDKYLAELRKLAGGYAVVDSVGISNSERGGYGKNVNMAMQAFHSGHRYALMIEDDWVLNRVLDIDPLLDCLDISSDIGCIRMGYLGFTQELRGRVVDVLGRKYLVFDPDSPEPHVFAGHPRLEAVVWQREVGVWPEGLPPGTTEFYVATELKRSRERVAWPMDLLGPALFDHIGTLRAY